MPNCTLTCLMIATTLIVFDFRPFCKNYKLFVINYEKGLGTVGEIFIKIIFRYFNFNLKAVSPRELEVMVAQHSKAACSASFRAKTKNAASARLLRRQLILETPLMKLPVSLSIKSKCVPVWFTC